MLLGEINLHHPDGPAMRADGGVWIPCGSLQSRKVYPKLYETIGQSYSDEDLRCCNAELFLCGPEIVSYGHKNNPTLIP